MAVRILVIDDESDVEVLFRQQFRRELRDGRFDLSFEQSGDEALQTMQSEDESDLVLSDINMPGMSGLDLLPRIKAEHPTLPVLMITAYGDANSRRVALERGADALLTKPIDFAALKSEIQARLTA